MKTIFLARHAKSSWRNINLQDIDRPLKASGVLTAQEVGKALNEKNENLDALISSPAIRALHTATIHARQLQFPEYRIEIKNSIYYRGKEGLYDLIKTLNPSFNSVMICGHDPTLANFVNDFLEIPLEKIQTSGVVKLSLNIDRWSNVKRAPVRSITYYKREEIRELKYAKKG